MLDFVELIKFNKSMVMLEVINLDNLYFGVLQSRITLKTIHEKLPLCQILLFAFNFQFSKKLVSLMT